MSETLNQQAELLGRYLINESPSVTVKKLYASAMTYNPGSIDQADQKLLNFITKNPWSIGLVDASLPFYKPDSEVRRRLYVLLAILEATPEYHQKFLSAERELSYIFYLAYTAFRAIVKTVVGSVLVRLVAR